MQNIQLSIPEPCHENWQHMTPTEQGRFCNACAKEVIDFSAMTDIQVLNYFTNLTHEKVCGRALPEQLDRTLSRPEHSKKKIFWYWNYIAMFLMFFTKGNSAKAQGGIKPTIEMSPVKNRDVKGEVNAVEGVKRMINGRVIDKNGAAVSFASIRVKGTNRGVSADVKGEYSLEASSNTILAISSAGFIETEMSIGNQLTLNSILEKASSALGEMAIITVSGGIKRTTRCGTSVVKTIAANPSIIFKVKGDGKDLLINRAIISITRKRDDFFEKYFSDTNGICEFKQINLNDNYFIKVVAEGFEPNEFTINAIDFIDRKKEWEVLLKKKKNTNSQVTQVNINQSVADKVPETGVRSNSEAKLGTATPVRMGAISSITPTNKILYVVDGTIMPNGENIKPANIDNIEILKGPVASALFGPDGANGAIVITTKKQKIKNLDTVIVTGYSTQRRTTRMGATSVTTLMGGITEGVTVKSTITDSLKMIATKITGAIKIYPNPVQRSQQFSIALKLKEAGLYQLHIRDAVGRIVLQKQISANAKELTEKIMTDSRWSAGIYYVSIINRKNQLVEKTSFIFE